MLVFLLMSATIFRTHASDTYAQEVPITLDVNDLSIAHIIDRIESTTDFHFVYKTKDVDLGRRLSFKVSNEKIETILERMFTASTTAYKVKGTHVILTRKPTSNLPTGEEKPLNPRDTLLVKGQVIDQNGAPLPLTNILEKGTSNGTQADFDGNFSLSVTNNNAVLVFSFIGYTTKEVNVNGQSSLSVQLEESEAGLDEVVVVGYGTTKKSDMTGAVSSIKSTAISERPLSNFGQVLQGNVSGVAVNSSSGAPGSDVQVRIRGLGSINSSVDPLYVVDGLPYTGNLNSINAYDIASIEILKDASSTAIYGSRGANGVVLITTKKGAGKGFNISYNGTYGVQDLRRKIDLLNATQYAELANEAETTIGNPERYSASDISSFHNGGQGTDWQDEIYRSAIIQTHQLSAMGGNEKLSFYLSGNYLNQDGIIKTSAFEKYSIRANLDANITDKLSVGNTLSVSRQKTSGVNAGGSTRSNSGNSNVVWAALVANPTLEIMDDNGDFIPNAPEPIFDNPVALLNGVVNDAQATEIIGSLYLNYDIKEWLSFKSTFGFGLQSSLNGLYTKKFIIGSNDGFASRSTTQNTNWVSTNQLNFNKTLGTDHKLQGNLISEVQQVTNESFSASSQGYVLDNLTYNDLSSGANVLIPNSGASKWALASFALRANYSLKDKYLMTFTGRYDGASRLAEGNKWHLFPSGAISWKISEEPFMASIDAVSSLKLRASYGQSGNQSVNVYSTLSILGPDRAIIGANEDIRTGFAPLNLPNQDLTWEISKQTDIGIDGMFFKGKVGLVLDYFNRKTEGLFFNRALPSIVGTTNLTATTNIGSVRNSGMEVEIDVNVIDGRDFQWNVTGNFTYTKNEVLALAENDTIYTGFGGEFGQTNGSQILAVGGNLGVFRGWLSDGLYGSDVSLTIDGATQSPGDLKYVDINGDGNISPDDRVVIGNAIPTHFWGLTNSFSYKGLNLTVFLQGSHGNQIVNLNRNTYLLSLDGKSNNELSTVDRWTPTNTDTDIPRATGVRTPMRFSDKWLEDGSYVRVKTVTLGYQFPASMLERLKISSLGLFVTGTNLITFTDYSGYDPDVARSSSVTQQGYDQGIYPQSKSYVVGLNIGF
ncbi:SusC/RagA family TonB-linked outer membrane protein [Echinicola strongylocentroti]|nr:TonB-dependent receptor [Echinicola strongylocentroti]